MAGMTSVRVLTWNLWWRFDDWRRRLEAIGAVLEEVRPDICCFQEVWSHEAADAAVLLGEGAGLPHVARSHTDVPERWQNRIDEPGMDFGNAIVSRWPIGETDVRRLPSTDGRTALAGRVDAPSGPVPVISTHLTAGPASSAQRCSQVRALVELVASFGRGYDFPPVIAGDLNAEPDSDEIRLLGGHKTAPYIDGLFFLDAWMFAADRSDPGWTWRRDNPYVAYGPSARIDYLHLGDFGPDGQGEVRSVEVVGDKEVGGVWPSDHLAVVADLSTGA